MTDVPRPPAGVLGGEWSLWLVLAVGVAAVVVVVAGLTAYRWWAGRGAMTPEASGGRSAREEALAELDRIRSLGWHRDGRVEEFYTSTTDALRRFAARIEGAWGPALTSRELVERMEERWGRRRLEGLTPIVERAERTKFGDDRPEPEAAEADWRAVRDWIRSAPE